MCRRCNGEVIAKCGTHRVAHWAHRGMRDCDTWAEKETDWHRVWKNNFPARAAVRGIGTDAIALRRRALFLASLSGRLSFLSRPPDEAEYVGDALFSIHSGDMVGIAAQDHQSRIGNESLILQRLLDRLQFALVARQDQSRSLDALQDTVFR